MSTRSACTVCWMLCARLTWADLTPVPILQSRLVLCLLCVGKIRLRERGLPKVTWLMRGSARVISRSSGPSEAHLLLFTEKIM